MKRFAFALALSGVLVVSACTSAPDPNARVTSVQPGEIIATEQVASANTQGASSAVRVGAAVLGALVPGPWGGVAGTAGRETGRAVLRNTGGHMRYFVKMPDGTIETIEQEDGPKVAKGDVVDVIRTSDGGARIVAGQPAQKADQAKKAES